MAENSDAGVVRQLLLPLAPFLKDESLYEVVINRPGEVLTEGARGWQRHELPDLSFDKLMRIARAVASFSNQGIDETRPLLSATLPDDERIQIVIPPATTRDTVSITIRKPSSVSLSMADMEAGGLFEAGLTFAVVGLLTFVAPLLKHLVDGRRGRTRTAGRARKWRVTMDKAARKIASGVLTTVHAIGCNATGSAFLAWTRQDE